MNDEHAGVGLDRAVAQAQSQLGSVDLTGGGTTLAGLSAGLPQLFQPLEADQFVNVEAVARHGVGAMLEGSDATAEAARVLLGGRCRRGGKVAGEFAAMPAPNEAAAPLMDIAR